MLFLSLQCFVTLFVALQAATAAPTAEQLSLVPSTHDSVGTFRSPAVSYNNTLVLQRADPHIVKHTDGWYYLTATVPAFDQVVIRRAKTIQGLQDAEEAVVFQRKNSGVGSGQVWAPELHYIDGKWYIYVALGVADVWRIRSFVFEGTGDNPLEANWVEKGLVQTNWNTFSLDASVFVANGVRYMVWAQTDPAFPELNSALLLAPMINPWTVELPAVAISYPDLPWEMIGHEVNEGPHVIKRNGTIFLTYSASATDFNYCMGMLTAPETANLMDPSVWKKSPDPVFVSNNETSQFGPGHNSFTVSEDGLSDILVFHDRGYRDIVGDPLNDPNRQTRVQKLYWRADGTPDFGIPVPDGETPVRLRLAANENLYIRHMGSGQAVLEEDVPVAETQFRIVSPGLAGPCTVSLESTTNPGSFLRRSDDGTVFLSADYGEAGFNASVSFKEKDGLSDGKGVSFRSLRSPSKFLKMSKQKTLVVGQVLGDEATATFFAE